MTCSSRIIIISYLTFFSWQTIGLPGDAKAAGPESKPGHRWIALPDHSSIEFRTSHWGILDIVGWFEDFGVSLQSDTLAWAASEIEVRIRTESVRMPNPEMAGNLRDMLSVAEFPEAVFRSEGVRFVSESSVRVAGKLTLHGVTRPLELVGRLNGYAFPPDGMPGLTLSGRLNRFNYAIGDSTISPSTGALDLGEFIYVTCNVRLEYVKPDGK